MSMVDFRAARGGLAGALHWSPSRAARANLVWAKMPEKALRLKFEKLGPCTQAKRWDLTQLSVKV